MFGRSARAFNRSGTTQAVSLDIPKAFHRVWHASLFGMMGSLHKNIQLMQGFLKSPFLVLHFSYNTLMNFLIMLSLILLSMLVILLSTLNAIRHMICGNN